MDWLIDDKREEALSALMVAMKDPDLVVDAFKALLKADEVNIKRRLAQLKVEEANEKQRLRLLEFARSLSPDELARLSRQSGVCIGETRRTDVASREDGKAAG
jgi:hypothetical protein